VQGVPHVLPLSYSSTTKRGPAGPRARAYLVDSDHELVTPRFGGTLLSLVTRARVAPYWRSALPTVVKELELSRVSTRAGEHEVG
jgi:hypothetical protein